MPAGAALLAPGGGAHAQHHTQHAIACPALRHAYPSCSYSKEWEVTVRRLGRWIDFQNDYKTLDPAFMESVW